MIGVTRPPCRLSASTMSWAQGVPLATLLRRRLEEQDEIAVELAALRRAVERSFPERAELLEEPSSPPGALLEALILLRGLAGLQKTTIAQKEVERRGLETWR